MTDFNEYAVLIFILFESRLVYHTSIDGDLLENSIVADCLDQESIGGQLVSVPGQHEVNSLTFCQLLDTDSVINL